MCWRSASRCSKVATRPSPPSPRSLLLSWHRRQAPSTAVEQRSTRGRPPVAHPLASLHPWHSRDGSGPRPSCIVDALAAPPEGVPLDGLPSPIARTGTRLTTRGARSRRRSCPSPGGVWSREGPRPFSWTPRTAQGVRPCEGTVGPIQARAAGVWHSSRSTDSVPGTLQEWTTIRHTGNFGSY